MSADKITQQAKYFGFQLGIDVAKQLIADGVVVDLNNAIKFARSMADGEITTTDPENSGQGLNKATEAVCRSIAMKSIASQQKHASDVCEGLISISDETLSDDDSHV